MRLRSITARDSDRMKTRPSLESDLSLLGELSQIQLIFQRTPLCLLSKEEKKKTITIKSSILDLISMEACFWHRIKKVFSIFFYLAILFTFRNFNFFFAILSLHLAILSFYSQFYLFTRNSEFIYLAILSLHLAILSYISQFYLFTRNSIFLLAILSLYLAILSLHLAILSLHLAILSLHLAILSLHLAILSLHLTILSLHLTILSLHLAILTLHLAILTLHLAILTLTISQF